MKIQVQLEMLRLQLLQTFDKFLQELGLLPLSYTSLFLLILFFIVGWILADPLNSISNALYKNIWNKNGRKKKSKRNS